MNFLNISGLEAINASDFQAAEPFPWVNPQGLLTAAGYRALADHAPDLSLFRENFGKARKHGQASHDRYVLDYAETLPIDPCWHEFVAELNSPEYRAFIRRLFGVRDFSLCCHWHYTPQGCSVSPHCDAGRKLGSHIFYLDDPADWPAQWGGQTLILDDGGRFGRRSAPAFEDFDRELAVSSTGNRSLLFARAGHSWHGVRPISCPPGRYRRAFIVVLEGAGSWVGAVRRAAMGALS